MKAAEYRSLNFGGEKVLVNSASLQILRKVGAVVFDCDGVLVDTRHSYDATIMQVTERMVSEIAGVRFPYRRVGRELIVTLRRTGGFNNDWDTTYALTVFSILALDEKRLQRVGEVKAPKEEKLQTWTGVGEALSRLRKITDRFCSSVRGIGYSAVKLFIENERLSPLQKSAVARAREYLGYPGSPPQCRMTTLFDELYHGPELFVEMYGFPPRYYNGRGMIQTEKLLINRRVLERVKKVLGGGRMAISTGRPFLAARYSLRHLMRYFNRRASTYIGDADVKPELADEYEKYRKPRGGSLLRAKEAFTSDGLLYVGDSAEDQMMVKNANGETGDILFGAISGTASDRDGQIKYFKQNGADLVMRSVGQVPLVLEAFRR